MTLNELQLKLAGVIHGSVFDEVSYFAGGCVRDDLLRKMGMDVPADMEEADIAVEMDGGGEALARFLSKKLETSEPVVYRSFGTASLVWQGIRLEFVMTRSESYRDRNRKPAVKHATLDMDASRRDFGINTLYMKIASAELLDPTGKGFRDIQDKVLRCVGTPAEVFAQDPLRMLRAIRFAARFGFCIDSDTWQGIQTAAQSVTHISRERIADEFNRILCHPDAQKAVLGVEMTLESRLLQYILPELTALNGLKQNRYHHLDAFGHTMAVLGNTSPGLCVRWAALLHDIGKASTRSTGTDGRTHFYGHERVGAELAGSVLKRFGISAPNRASIITAIGGHMLFKHSGSDGSRLKDATLRRYRHGFGKDMDILLELAHADNLAHHPDTILPLQIPGIRTRLHSMDIEKERFSLTGKDIMREFGTSEGIRIGEMLSYARGVWFDDPTLGKRDMLERIAHKFKLKKIKEPD